MAYCQWCRAPYLSEQGHRCGVIGSVQWAPDRGKSMPRSVDVPEFVESARQADRVRDGMRALARFMVWVVLEAEAHAFMKVQHPHQGVFRAKKRLVRCRRLVFTGAVRRYFTLAWPTAGQGNETKEG